MVTHLVLLVCKSSGLQHFWKYLRIMKREQVCQSVNKRMNKRCMSTAIKKQYLNNCKEEKFSHILQKDCIKNCNEYIKHILYS